jgi:hypothetical protein
LGGTYCLHLQGRKVSQARNEHEVVDYHQSTQHYIPKDTTFHNCCCENLKSNNFVQNHIFGYVKWTVNTTYRRISSRWRQNRCCGGLKCGNVFEEYGLCQWFQSCEMHDYAMNLYSFAAPCGWFPLLTLLRARHPQTCSSM